MRDSCEEVKVGEKVILDGKLRRCNVPLILCILDKILELTFLEEAYEMCFVKLFLSCTQSCRDHIVDERDRLKEVDQDLHSIPDECVQSYPSCRVGKNSNCPPYKARVSKYKCESQPENAELQVGEKEPKHG